MNLAYSRDTQGIITAEKADQLYQKGEITDPRNFLCPGCKEVAVTCVNLATPKKERRRVPHFRVKNSQEAHRPGCPIIKKKTPQKTVANSQEKGSYKMSEIITLDFTKSSNEVSGNTPDERTSTASRTRVIADHNTNTKLTERRNRKGLAEIVDIFLNTKEQAESSEENIFIEIFGQKINICDLFVEVNGQDIETLSEKRIYYGKAWVNCRNEGYDIHFEKDLSSKGQGKRTSFLIKWEEFEKSNSGQSKREDFEKMDDHKPRDIYLFAPPPKPKKGNPYINFTCEKLNYLECREPKRENLL